MGEAGRELAERHHPLALLLRLRGVPHPVGHDGDEALAQLGRALEHLREVPPVQLEEPAGLEGRHVTGVVGETRVGQGAADATRMEGVVELELAAHGQEDLEGARQHHEHVVRGIAGVEQPLAGCRVHHFALVGQPGQQVVGQAREVGDGAQVVDRRPSDSGHSSTYEGRGHSPPGNGA